MDKLSGLASKLGGGNKESGSSGGNQQEDYLDKGESLIVQQCHIGREMGSSNRGNRP